MRKVQTRALEQSGRGALAGRRAKRRDYISFLTRRSTTIPRIACAPISISAPLAVSHLHLFPPLCNVMTTAN